MNQSISIRLLPFIVFITIGCTMFSWLDTALYNSGPIVISILGSLLFCGALFYTVNGMQTIREFHEETKRHNLPFLGGYNIVGNCILWVIMCFVFNASFDSRKEAELSQFGIKTTGTITYGEAYESSRDASYNVNVSYNGPKGQKIVSTVDVSRYEFDKFYVGQQVEVLYSAKNPALYVLLTNDDAIKTYTGVKNREVTIADLVAIAGMRGDSVTSFLKSIDYEWQYDSRRGLWKNEGKDIGIAKPSPTSVSYLNAAMSPRSIYGELKDLGFTEIKMPGQEGEKISPSERVIPSLGTNNGVYENEQYALSIEHKRLKSAQIATIIAVQKK